ncbi:hypothetical protein DQ04_12571000 [Trypanosoma grayi]|uniref:hypothetical protein n=1 Tax=Trypanosoma grayi TaxID=71804 RepID=UPI0004F4064C|nr:hypothetical protein DQ04_12571000 [Trypanosoma grayi]KEG06721.1 hypothetical protein DQ04_12571000 [Trypanosoma grayi]
MQAIGHHLQPRGKQQQPRRSTRIREECAVERHLTHPHRQLPLVIRRRPPSETGHCGPRREPEVRRQRVIDADEPVNAGLRAVCHDVLQQRPTRVRPANTNNVDASGDVHRVLMVLWHTGQPGQLSRLQFRILVGVPHFHGRIVRTGRRWHRDATQPAQMRDNVINVLRRHRNPFTLRGLGCRRLVPCRPVYHLRKGNSSMPRSETEAIGVRHPRCALM